MIVRFLVWWFVFAALEIGRRGVFSVMKSFSDLKSFVEQLIAAFKAAQDSAKALQEKADALTVQVSNLEAQVASMSASAVDPAAVDALASAVQAALPAAQ